MLCCYGRSDEAIGETKRSESGAVHYQKSFSLSSLEDYLFINIVTRDCVPEGALGVFK